MGSLWLKNLLGMGLTEEQYGNIPHPRVELFIHVAYRAVQGTSFLGAFVVAPLVTLGKGPRNLQALSARCRSYAVYGALPGLVLGPCMYFGRMRGQPEEGYFDRCYRLRHNKNQVRVDRFSIGGAAAGTLLCTVSTYRPIEGLIFGMLGGVITAAVLNSTLFSA
ncbi:hypothetical protein D915_007312 [Fasciola hepatica]|uniref:Uncharacterized protein n=1 Tax=Fasciola hepatica TaxID=6192 RepID=A0A4E0R6P4_FASHE|nr:hypothetical protein D915_007312 [Fasciola hepatica]